ncbi:MAG TPA: cytidylate kinase, partial [Methanocorpusculum sp.]|nr:cytidylate kinase [Methanocorpusculum sp.]
DRENLTPEKSYELTVEREKCEADRYMAYYDIDITDQTPYHLVLSSERFNQEQVLSIVSAAVEQL